VQPKLTHSRVDKEIVVRLKWGETEYKGRLISVDLYMNIQLSDTEEFIDGTSSGTLGQVLIRCNNVLWIGKADEVEPKVAKDTEMSG
jgi:small nuclear ribonucleoprotein F